MRIQGTVVLLVGGALLGCAARVTTDRGLSARVASASPGSGASVAAGGTGGTRCDADRPDREATEYDTTGDQEPDVRKVYRRVGEGESARLVMICRESDVNGDGRKDVIRYYDDEGNSVREDVDRNLDGRIDMTAAFQGGRVITREFDDNHDGRVDGKVYYEKGMPVRAERDLAGRSTADVWRPDRWEYFEDGRLVRMGTDFDGDARVDRWDRDARREDDETGIADGGPTGADG